MFSCHETLLTTNNRAASCGLYSNIIDGMKNEPKEIYLNVGQIEGHEQIDFKECEAVTWSENHIYENDIKYIRSDGWIPVTERLPEERENTYSDYVLGYSDKFRGTYFVIRYDYDSEQFLHDKGHDSEFNPITHWMPLPDST
jgi:hypothetical protein